MRYMMLIVLFFGSAWNMTACAEEKAQAKNLPEKLVTPVEGAKKFTVKGRSTKFRIAVTAIAGGSISAPQIQGNAKLISSATIERVDEDGQPQIGAIEQEFVFQGTAAGVVTIVFTIKNPAEVMPVNDSYTVTLK